MNGVFTAYLEHTTGTLRPVTLRGEPLWHGVSEAGTVDVSRADLHRASHSDPRTPAGGSPVRLVGAAPAPGPAGPSSDGPSTGASAHEAPRDSLEAEVYASRDVHGEERGQVRRTLLHARSRMSESTYRRALVLARDSGLLTLEECLAGALAMEWEPQPRPEFTLAAIEETVDEQLRNDPYRGAL